MASADKVAANDTAVEQLVVFTLGKEFYGVGIERVQTIIRLPEITRVPHTPDHILGVINLRGMIVPVIDLRTRFGLPDAEVTKATRVVVVDNHGLQVGMVVDAVTQTLQLPTSAIEPFSAMVTSVDTEYLRGVGKDEDRLVILLALDEILSRDDVGRVQGAIGQSDDALDG